MSSASRNFRGSAATSCRKTRCSSSHESRASWDGSEEATCSASEDSSPNWSRLRVILSHRVMRFRRSSALRQAIESSHVLNEDSPRKVPSFW
jgi:hypothetical protein